MVQVVLRESLLRPDEPLEPVGLGASGAETSLLARPNDLPDRRK